MLMTIPEWHIQCFDSDKKELLKLTIYENNLHNVLQVLLKIKLPERIEEFKIRTKPLPTFGGLPNTKVEEKPGYSEGSWAQDRY